MEKFVKMINAHAYVEIAMRSTNFCTSAKNGLQVVASNFIRFGILHGLSSIVMAFVELLITIGGTFIGYIMIVGFGQEKREFHGTASSLFVIALITWIVARLFAHIWEATSDAILHCYCIDEALEKGHAKHSTVKLNNAVAAAEDRQGKVRMTKVENLAAEGYA
jgi:solute carrier family 44 protein 1 (choline transporter-like protein)